MSKAYILISKTTVQSKRASLEFLFDPFICLLKLSKSN